MVCLEAGEGASRKGMSNGTARRIQSVVLSFNGGKSASLGFDFYIFSRYARFLPVRGRRCGALPYSGFPSRARR